MTGGEIGGDPADGGFEMRPSRSATFEFGSATGGRIEGRIRSQSFDPPGEPHEVTFSGTPARLALRLARAGFRRLVRRRR